MKNQSISLFRPASRLLRAPWPCLWLIWAAMVPQTANGEDWPQWRGPQRDGVWRETGIVSELPEKLNFKWRIEIGQGYAGPAVAGNRLYVTDLVTAPDDRTSGGNRERVLCMDAGTGATLWKHEYVCDYEISYPQGPRATPTVHEGKVYTVGAMGDLLCLDAATGEVRWSRNYIRDFGAQAPVWGFSAAPLVDGGKLIPGHLSVRRRPPTCHLEPKGPLRPRSGDGQGLLGRGVLRPERTHPGHTRLRSGPEPPLRERLLRRSSHDAHQF